MNLQLFLLEAPVAGTADAALQILNNPWVLGGGIAFIIIAIVLVLLIKQVIVNSILGIIALLALQFVFNIQLPWIPAIVVSAIFGLAGIGAMLLLKFFGAF
ncbi:MAG: hypothetical protein PHH08_01375 [Candidatus ainarchaeum sp.]|nr:hypothetical protein [Candidatus ainarchaeum sp.]